MARTSPSIQGDISLYRQVSSILREQIDDGVLRPGDRLPSEEALRADYGISRGTVRQALDALERDGMIERAAGRGTFVRSGQRAAPRERNRAGWQALVTEAPLRATRLSREGSAPAPHAVLRALGLASGTETPFFIRLTPGRGQPIGVKRYLHPDLAPHAGTLAADPDFPCALGLLGSQIMGPAWVEAILAEPRFAMQLKVPLGAPLLSFWWIDRLDGQPAACTQMIQPGATTSLLLATGDDDAL